ncbi:unnamed protein product [Amoebophrya sp. A120]|nr:unnamed protein product [Amoebophrya sp. A120]|eukprot:GSA120T00005054001.1
MYADHAAPAGKQPYRPQDEFLPQPETSFSSTMKSDSMGSLRSTIRSKLPYDSREIDHSVSRVLEERNNTFGNRAWMSESDCGSHGPTASRHSLPTKSGPDFLATWTGPGQRFGFRHSRDADHFHSRQECFAEDAQRRHMPTSNKNKVINFSSRAPPVVYRVNDSRLAPGRFPVGTNWKLNKYGCNMLPVRYPGGISSWLPSHTENRWSAQKFDVKSEMPRVLSEQNLRTTMV